MSAGVGVKVGQRLGVDNSALTARNLARAGVANTAGAIAGAAMRSVTEGSDFGDNLMSTLPDVIGSTIGNMIAGGLSAKPSGGSSGQSSGGSSPKSLLGKLAGGVGDFLGFDGQFGYQGNADGLRTESLAGFGNALQGGVRPTIGSNYVSDVGTLRLNLTGDDLPGGNVARQFRDSTNQMMADLDATMASLLGGSPLGGSSADLAEITVNTRVGDLLRGDEGILSNAANPTGSVRPTQIQVLSDKRWDSLRGREFDNPDALALEMTKAARQIDSPTELSSPIIRRVTDGSAKYYAGLLSQSNSSSGATVDLSNPDTVGTWHLHPARSIISYMFSDADYRSLVQSQSKSGGPFGMYIASKYDPDGNISWRTYSLPNNAPSNLLSDPSRIIVTQNVDDLARVSARYYANQPSSPLAVMQTFKNNDNAVTTIRFGVIGQRVK